MPARAEVTISEQPHALQAGMALFADDDVIVHRNAERGRDVDDRLGHLNVGGGGRRVAGGVIVDQYTRRLIRVVFQWFAKL